MPWVTGGHPPTKGDLREWQDAMSRAEKRLRDEFFAMEFRQPDNVLKTKDGTYVTRMELIRIANGHEVAKKYMDELNARRLGTDRAQAAKWQHFLDRMEAVCKDEFGFSHFWVVYPGEGRWSSAHYGTGPKGNEGSSGSSRSWDGGSGLGVDGGGRGGDGGGVYAGGWCPGGCPGSSLDVCTIGSEREGKC